MMTCWLAAGLRKESEGAEMEIGVRGTKRGVDSSGQKRRGECDKEGKHGDGRSRGEGLLLLFPARSAHRTAYLSAGIQLSQ